MAEYHLLPLTHKNRWHCQKAPLNGAGIVLSSEVLTAAPLLKPRREDQDIILAALSETLSPSLSLE